MNYREAWRVLPGGTLLLAMVCCLGVVPLMLAGGAWSAEESSDEVGTRAAPPNLPLMQATKQFLPMPFPIVVDCLLVEIMTNKTSVQVKCGGLAQLAGQGGPTQLFAVGLEDPAFVSRVMKVAISGQVVGHHVLISYEGRTRAERDSDVALVVVSFKVSPWNLLTGSQVPLVAPNLLLWQSAEYL